ncbi:MAG: GHMP kinase [Anaerolineales bacterium]|nr:GHMP kinase [Anaerolineales bacterium]
MIIVQTPLRVSLFGGGTDFPTYYNAHGGCVLSFTIDKYIFVTIKKRFDDLLRVGYTRTEMTESIDEIEHELIRESLRKTGFDMGLEITTMGDIPSAGSGLGSSSTVTVGALHAMYTQMGEIVPAERLAREACEIEIDVLGKPIGIQDQYIAAFGGLRFMEFQTNGEVFVDRVEINEKTQRALNQNLMLFFTGITRKSAKILKEQKSNIDQRLAILGQLKEMAQVARRDLVTGKIDTIGELLHESWQMKKQLASTISNGAIDDMYTQAREAGAIGGKITGAGGGGFLLLYCPYEKQEIVRDALGLQELPFKIERDGSKVIFNYNRSY